MDALHHRFSFREGMNHSAVAAYNGSGLGWRFPALCLFIAVAAMLVLVACASVILICTWWRLARGTMRAGTHLESMASGHMKSQVICGDDEKVLVIMPGDHKPTFLASHQSSETHLGGK
ncbi:hypothetical protein SUGI_0896220 [Cryptomeria japonica]|nr:hypothetical protein SUGI_0896220 [Cryptomeria japonica]